MLFGWHARSGFSCAGRERLSLPEPEMALRAPRSSGCDGFRDQSFSARAFKNCKHIYLTLYVCMQTKHIHRNTHGDTTELI